MVAITFLAAAVSLLFSGWLAWTLLQSLREEAPVGLADYVSAGWIAAGSLSGVVTTVLLLLK